MSSLPQEIVGMLRRRVGISSVVLSRSGLQAVFDEGVCVLFYGSWSIEKCPDWPVSTERYEVYFRSPGDAQSHFSRTTRTLFEEIFDRRYLRMPCLREVIFRHL